MPRIELDVRTPAWALPLREPARYKGASGGRASGKSHFFAERAVLAMVCNPNLRFVCIREVQRALKYSAKSLIEAKIRGMGVAAHFDILTTEIRRKGGTGVMIFEGMQDHTADSIKSLEGFDRAWVEEAHALSQKSLDILIPTIRAPGSEVWFSWNPNQPTDAVDMFFAKLAEKGNGDSIHVTSTWRENPFLEGEDGEVVRNEALRMKEADPDTYEHVWGGGYFLGGSGRVYSSFVNREWPEGNTDQAVDDTGAEILVGMDFNVDPMSAVIGVRVVDELHVLDAIEMGTSNTHEMAQEIRDRYPDRHVIACPDPAGKQRKTSAAGKTDFSILESFGFEVRSPGAAPAVRDRVNNTNTMFYDDLTGRRRVKVHPRAKPLITALMNQVFKAGTSIPEKGKFDHMPDAIGYLLWQEFNVLHQGGEVSFTSLSPF